jgi:predicted nucleic acid-binding protein
LTAFLLDTNVVSELRKGHRIHRSVRRFFESVDESGLFLSVLVLGELRQGIDRLAARDASAAARLERWLVGLGVAYSDRILSVDLPVAEVWGRLNARRSLPAVDGLLAATAIVHDLTLVTRNVRDVSGTGVRTVNPFDA